MQYLWRGNLCIVNIITTFNFSETVTETGVAPQATAISAIEQFTNQFLFVVPMIG